jgi:voltage-gated potassium channel
VFLVAYAWEVIADLHGPAAEVTDIIIWFVWGVFVVDYVMSLALAPRKVHWFFTHFHLFLVVALPILRPLRLLRLVTLWTVLQRAAGTVLRGRIAMYVLGSSLLLVIIAALAVLEAERHAPGASIKDIGSALWWAFVTIATVGYGDYTPVTFEGRLIAVGLMIAGIALLGIVTATLASWMVERVANDEKDIEKVTLEQIKALSKQVEALSAQLTKTQGATDSQPVRSSLD